MTTYRNINFKERNYECVNIVACVAPVAPSENYVEVEDKLLIGLEPIFQQNNVQYYGWL